MEDKWTVLTSSGVVQLLTDEYYLWLPEKRYKVSDVNCVNR